MVHFISQNMVHDVVELDRKVEFISSWNPESWKEKLLSSGSMLNAYESQVLSHWYSQLLTRGEYDKKLYKEGIQNFKAREYLFIM